MNVVGRVGNLITQGVYSVATPFHPFGGAVDIIVVEQEDGTYRSTPWYVRFGKFQGVIKGAEKIVRISVNGVEAGFHMFLDNSGEAYFVREVESVNTQGEPNDDGGHDSDTHDSTPNDNLNKKNDVLHDNNDENAKVEKDEQPYEFQDENSSSEVSISSPSFAPYHYGSLDEAEDIAESTKKSNSEMVLVSVDGYVLTAPITSNEENTENVQLNTPQFHLGPGDSSGDDFGSEGEGWVASLLGDLDGSSPKHSETCEFPSGALNGGVNCSYHEPGETNNENIVQTTDSLVENCPSLIRNDTFMSCVEVSELTSDNDDSDSQNLGSPNLRDVYYRSVIPEHVEEERFDGNESNGNCIPLLRSDLASSEMFNGKDHKVQDRDSKVAVDVNIERVSSGQVSFNIEHDTTVVGLSLTLSSESNLNSESSAIHMESRNDEKRGMTIENTDNEETIYISDHAPKSDNKQELEPRENSESKSSVDEGIEISESQKPDPTESTTSKFTIEEGTEVSESQNQGSEPTESSISKFTIEEGIEGSESQNQETSSSLGFEVSLCGSLLRAGMGNSSADEAFKSYRISKEDFEANGPSIVKNKNLIVRFDGKYFRWDKAAPIVLGIAVFGLNLSIDMKDAVPVEQEFPKIIEEASSISPSTRWRLWQIPFRRVKSLQHTNSSSSNVEEFVDSESISQNPQAESSVQQNNHDDKSPRKQYVRTNVPTTEQIASLNLKDGQNMVAFSFCTRVLGTQKVDAHIYLWKWNARIVISDVDGTITKSDVLGQFMPLVGKDWSQSGVAKLFCAIKENGYQLLFLSARAIVQAYLTRSFLLNLKQDGKTLPNGPIVISPDGLFPSLYREVIRRAPHEFKIACLEDIKALFPSDYNPFYAGFGNRDTDELSYRKIGIPKGKIFIINPKGEVAINHRIDVKSYTSLHTLVNDMFPPTSLIEQEDYNSWNYWKMPLPTIDD